MTPSELVASFLSPISQRAFAETKEQPKEDKDSAPALSFEKRQQLYREHGPSLLAKDIQTGIHKFIFGQSIKSLEEAKKMHELLIASLDMTLDSAKKNSK